MHFTGDLNLHHFNDKEALERIERRLRWIVEALHTLLKGQPDAATVAALTAKLNAEADALKASVEANK